MGRSQGRKEGGREGGTGGPAPTLGSAQRESRKWRLSAIQPLMYCPNSSLASRLPGTLLVGGRKAQEAGY